MPTIDELEQRLKALEKSVTKVSRLVDFWEERLQATDNRITVLEPHAVPIGTIVSSLLSWELFREVIPRADEFWVPADGRDLPATCQLTARTQRTTAPDLRGVFVRGLNTFDAVRGARPADGDPQTRAVGDLQRDAVGWHDHGMRGEFANVPHGGGGHALGYLDRYGQYRTTGAGDAETRPKNVAVYFYLRVN